MKREVDLSLISSFFIPRTTLVGMHAAQAIPDRLEQLGGQKPLIVTDQGIVAVGILISLRIRSIFEITWIASDIITTGVFVPLVLAFFWRRGTSRGALCSMLCGLAYCLYNLAIFLGMPLPAFWEQQSALQVILGVCLSLLVFTVTSLLDEPEYHKADAFLARTR